MAIQALSSLFATPPGYQIPGCGAASYSAQPQLAVGCVAGFCDPNLVQVQPHSLLWRAFPVAGNPADALWYAPASSGNLGTWKLVNWWAPDFVQPSGAPMRPIDIAFANSNWVERGATVDRTAGFSVSPFAPGSGFLQGFASAWRANQEYALNGLQPQADPKILLQFLRFWNRAHEPSTQVTMHPGGSGSYAESLVTGAVALASSTDDFVSPDGGLLVNVGALKTAAVAPAAGGPTPSGGQAPTAAGGSTAAAVGVGALALAAAGGGLWLALGKPLTVAAAKAAFDALGRKLLP
jgi:hypothetical protein